MASCPETGHPVDRAFKMRGEILDDKYKVGRLIGRGGMGVVYQGEHLAVGRKVAIKFLTAEASESPEMLTRFQNEARMAAAVGHRNIVDILDLGQTSQGVHYIVMEYLNGRDLGDLMHSASRLDVKTAVEIAIQVLSALRAVHERGIVHRDLKPENVIIVKGEGRALTAKLVDFGLSRLDDSMRDVGLTQTGTVCGTPRYMAPEQARAKKDIDLRADLYSVGVILYRMLTGHVPFEAGSYNEMIIAITTEEPTHINAHKVPLPEGLADLVMRAMSRDPRSRFQSATEFFEAVRPFRTWTFEGTETSSSPSPQPILNWSGIRREVTRQPRDDLKTPVDLESPAADRRGRATDSGPLVGSGNRSHTYSVVGGKRELVDVVHPARQAPPLRLGAAADEPFSQPAAPAPRPSSSSGYSVINRDDSVRLTDRVAVSGRTPRVDAPREDVATSGEKALRDAMKRTGLTPRPARRQRRSSTAPWTSDGAPAGRKGQGIDEPDDSISTIGWEGPTGVRVRRMPVPGWAMGVGAAVVLAIAAGGTSLFLKLRNVENGVSGVSVQDTQQATAAAEAPPTIWKVAFENLPEGAEVYVDGSLHLERPVLVTYSAEPKMLRIEAKGYEPWEKAVAVYSDISVTLPLVATDAGPVPADEAPSKTIIRKIPPSGEPGKVRIDTQYPGSKESSRIDKSYPGLK
jgi:serine/threonine-protein kinase